MIKLNTYISRAQVQEGRRSKRIKGTLGKRPCVLFSTEMGGFKSGDEWTGNLESADVGTLSDMIALSEGMPPSLGLRYYFIKNC